MIESEMDRKKQKINIINAAFFVLSCLAFCYWSVTLGILTVFILPFIFCNILLAVFHSIYRKNGRFRPAVTALRCAVIMIIAVLSVPPYIITRFENNEAMYPAKRIVYTYGVKKRASDVLPSKLPDKADGYVFFTQTSLHGPDYVPCSFLSFVCDDVTAKDYLNNYVDEAGVTKCERRQTFKEYIQENYSDETILEDKISASTLISRYLDIPSFPTSRLYALMQTNQMIQFAENAEVYELDGYPCLAYDTKNNIFAFWV